MENAIELQDDLPVMSPSMAAEKFKQYQDICKAILVNDDYQTIGNKAFKKKSAWRKLARAFSISDEIIEEKREDLSEGHFMWRIKVRAYAPNGRQSIGVAACASNEENKKFAHVQNDVYTTAHTRAKNRAISDLIGSGEVSAEELEENPHTKEYAMKINAKASGRLA